MIVRQAVIPALAAYLLVAAVIVYGSRRPPEPRPRPVPLSRALVRRVVALFALGYPVFLAIVGVFHELVVGDRGALREAAAGGLLLVAIGAPAFVLLSWLDGLRGRRWC